MLSSDAIDDLSVGRGVFQNSSLKLKKFGDVTCNGCVIPRLKKCSCGGIAKGA
ncbi:hypothetical protein D3C76_680410 [compost metagenome]